jgi:CRISPR-associated protein Csd2
MNTEIKRATGLLVIEAVSSNPNGDPDRDSEPRTRPNGQGEISPVSFKRKLRDLLEDTNTPFFQSLPDKFRNNPDNYAILESRGRNRQAISAEMGDSKVFNEEAFLNSTFVRKYWDARIFGNTFLEEKKKEKDSDQGEDSDESGDGGKKKKSAKSKDAPSGIGMKGFIKSGVVQFGVGTSLARVNIVSHTNTNKAGVQEGKNAGMAPLAFKIVEHGVYLMPFFVNPNYARKSGCTADDIELLKLLIPQAYDLNRSAVRPDVRIRHAWYIEHKNALGSCPDYLLLEALSPVRIGNTQEPSASWSDYEDKRGLPQELLTRVESAADLALR